MDTETQTLLAVARLKKARRNVRVAFDLLEEAVTALDDPPQLAGTRQRITDWIDTTTILDELGAAIDAARLMR